MKASSEHDVVEKILGVIHLSFVLVWLSSQADGVLAVFAGGCLCFIWSRHVKALLAQVLFNRDIEEMISWAHPWVKQRLGHAGPILAISSWLPFAWILPKKTFGQCIPWLLIINSLQGVIIYW